MNYYFFHFFTSLQTQYNLNGDQLSSPQVGQESLVEVEQGQATPFRLAVQM